MCGNTMVQICKSQDRQPADNAGGERGEMGPVQ